MITLNQKFNNLKQDYNQRVGQLQAFRSRFDICQGQINELKKKENISQKASLFLQSLNEVTRIQILDKISGIVTEVLQVIKDTNLEFRMYLSTERNQADLKMVVYDKITNEEYNVLDSMGGGIADLISISLRLALLCKWQPTISRILVFDEAGKHISVKDQENLAEFISKLSKLLNIQFIWISHSEILSKSADRIFEITKIDGVSKVEVKNGL